MFRIGVSSVFPNVDLLKLELSIERRIQRKYDLGRDLSITVYNNFRLYGVSLNSFCWVLHFSNFVRDIY